MLVIKFDENSWIMFSMSSCFFVYLGLFTWLRTLISVKFKSYTTLYRYVDFKSVYILVLQSAVWKFYQFVIPFSYGSCLGIDLFVKPFSTGPFGNKQTMDESCLGCAKKFYLIQVEYLINTEGGSIFLQKRDTIFLPIILDWKYIYFPPIF